MASTASNVMRIKYTKVSHAIFVEQAVEGN